MRPLRRLDNVTWISLDAEAAAGAINSTTQQA
jgi:hypothetical protein